MHKIKEKKPITQSRIPGKATDTSEHRQDEFPVISFMHTCNRNCQLSDWRGKELDLLVNFFKKVEKLTWIQITMGHGGLDYTRINPDECSIKLPEFVSKDVGLFELSVDKVKRVWGYRSENILRVIWFDKNHDVLPWHKTRRA